MSGQRTDADVRVIDLQPGDLVMQPMVGSSATLLSWSTPHPIYPGLALVLWRLHHEDGFSVDALHPEQVVGTRARRTDQERFDALAQALPHAGAAR